MRPVGINYVGGFASANSPDELKSIIESTRNVSAEFYQTNSDAYVSLVCEYVRKNNTANILPAFPEFNDWNKLPHFIAPNSCVSPVTIGRTFILLNLEYAGVYNDIDAMISDFVYFENLFLKEVPDELEAVNSINRFYKDTVYRAMPYIATIIPFIDGPIPKNYLHHMPYLGIIKMAMEAMPKEIYGLLPNLSTTKTKLKTGAQTDENANGSLIEVATIV